MPRPLHPKPGAPLRARNGDRLVVRGHRVGESERHAEIIEVLGDDGAPPYVVRWIDDGRVTQILPGSDAYINRLSPARLSR
jgi:Domain of unknown function (DUF1918)